MNRSKEDLGNDSEKEQPKRIRTYQRPDGSTFSLTEEEFAQVVEIFATLRRFRDLNNAQVDSFEPDCSGETAAAGVELNRKAA